MEIFQKNINGQYIDSIGKTRVIFVGNIPVILSVPIRPFEISIKTLSDIKPLKIDEVVDFVKKYKLKISEVINATPRYYVKVEKDKENFLIPIVPVDNFKVGSEEVEILIKPDPLFTNEKSELLEYRYQKKISEYLKLYTLYYFINLGDPEFEIIEDHEYDIGVLKDTLYLPGSTADGVIYSGNKIIVLSEKMAENLQSYLDTQKANGYKTITEKSELKFSNKIDYYVDVYDYRSSEKFMIFESTDKLIDWFVMNENKKNNLGDASQNFKVNSVSPFYYFNKNIHSVPVLIQPIFSDDLDSENALALSVSVISYWNENKINIGGESKIRENFTIKPLKNYTIINMENNNIKNTEIIGKNSKNFVIKNNNKYYAVLFF